MTSGTEHRRIAVVGAGIVGVAVALTLQRRGRPVTLIDRDEPGRGASYGNMASIAVTEFMPASRPSMWAQLPGWLLDPQGPVRLRPTYLPKLAPWFMRFVAASRPSRVRELEAAGAALCQRVYEDLEPLLDEAGAAGLLGEEGCLSLYADDAQFAADREHLQVIERFGLPHRLLQGEAIQALEPAIGSNIRRAVLLPHNRSISDPLLLTQTLIKRFQSLGGRVERGEVIAFGQCEGAVSSVRIADGRHIESGTVILCCGAYTARLSKLVGDFIPMETERGYHTQIMSPGISMRHSIIWPAKAFMVTPTAGGIRVGGTVEMAGLEAPPDYRRARVLVERAKQALPGLQVRDTSEWMGHRPALPDTVPVIGPSARVRGVYYAAGHGHLGLTLSATTARLIADLVCGMTPPVDMSPYRVSRFGRTSR
ncbi:NAD(P)/FAD-dependent oxidoreductase [Variovorax paradoxus]|uniref:NAD(P)/FAD-dependent oxidoreductase n=1 Tax=Variovorax paradoxus TaxID=34073 RepID=UPI0007858BA5|nr:FAD-binding oxidoreductase [Variovorax paradoxus]